MEGPLSVSVVIPTKDRARILSDCLESLLQQESGPDRWEIVVVDDGSSDSTREVVAEAASRNASIRYVARTAGGLNAARNAGIDAAAGEVIAFLDDDVLCSPGWLNAFVSGARRYPGPNCFGGPIRLRLEAKPPRACGREPLGESELNLGRVERVGVWVWGGNLAVTRAAIERAGRFDETLQGGRSLGAEELEWEQRLVAAGGEVVYLPEAWIWHRRLAQDLQLGRMLKARFGRGRTWPMAATYRSMHTSVAGAAWRVLAGLAHALRRRCWVGVFQAVEASGWALEESRLLLKREGSPFMSWWPRS